MKRQPAYALLLMLALFAGVSVYAQSEAPARVTLTNGEAVNGNVVEYVPGSHIKLTAFGDNVITIQQADIKSVEFGVTGSGWTKKVRDSSKAEGGLSFESNTEAVVAFGVDASILRSDDIFGGVYSANGLCYRNSLFGGIGIGIQGHSNTPNLMVPFTIDLRYRLLPNAKFRPMIGAFGGAAIHSNEKGSWVFGASIGATMNVSERLGINLSALYQGHQYFDKTFSFFGDSGLQYLHYIGLRAGISFRR